MQIDEGVKLINAIEAGWRGWRDIGKLPKPTSKSSDVQVVKLKLWEEKSNAHLGFEIENEKVIHYDSEHEVGQ